MIEWREEYSTGFEDLDAQHRVLFRYINGLEKMIRAGRHDRSYVASTLAFLESYCQTHFKHEEGCMARHQCTAASQNKASHNSFLKTYEALHQRFLSEADSEGIAKEIHRHCVDWITDHICKIDTNLRACKKQTS